MAEEARGRRANRRRVLQGPKRLGFEIYAGGHQELLSRKEMIKFVLLRNTLKINSCGAWERAWTIGGVGSREAQGVSPQAWHQPRRGWPRVQAPSPRALRVMAVGAGCDGGSLQQDSARITHSLGLLGCAHSASHSPEAVYPCCPHFSGSVTPLLFKTTPQASQMPLRKGLEQAPPGRGAQNRACAPRPPDLVSVPGGARHRAA